MLTGSFVNETIQASYNCRARYLRTKDKGIIYPSRVAAQEQREAIKAERAKEKEKEQNNKENEAPDETAMDTRDDSDAGVGKSKPKRAVSKPKVVCCRHVLSMTECALAGDIGSCSG